MILQGSCSESVFRFHTTDPKQMQFILQSVADEVNDKYPDESRQKIPLLKTEEYDTEYGGKPSYRFMFEDSKKILSHKESTKKAYPKGALIYACAGLGDNEAVVRVNKEKGYFTLNIGNNDISEDTTGWIDKVKSLGIKVEEAETCEELMKLARDCTCGCTYGF